MKISIITPCFNSENTIERTIRSVVNQKGDFELEYIIVDGMSKDKTINIIKSYADRFDYIKYISEKDNSMTEALNKGIRLASGDIICSINADDEYLPEALKSVIFEFEKDPSKKVVVGNCYIVDANSDKIRYKLCPKYFNYFVANALDCITTECQIFFRRECFKKVGVFNEEIKYTQDYEFYLRLLKYGYKFNYINKDISKFYMSDVNYSSAMKDKMKIEVNSYIHLKFLHKLFSINRFNQFIRVLLGIRKVNYGGCLWKEIH